MFLYVFLFETEPFPEFTLGGLVGISGRFPSQSIHNGGVLKMSMCMPVHKSFAYRTVNKKKLLV